MDVNEAWNCDKGRFVFGYLTADTRLTEPALRHDDALTDTTWSQALTQAADAIRSARAAGPNRIALLTGARLADEDSYVAAKFARVVLGTDDVDARLSFASTTQNDELAAYAAETNTATYQAINDAKTIVVVGLDPEDELPIVYLRIRKAWRNNTAKIVVVGPSTGSLAAMTWRHAPQGLIGTSVAATTAMRRNARWPAATADPIATRSAHMVRPKLRFSTLQPVKTVPSSHSRAAPTAKFE
jgi:NADH-quinone oxidoreductase subunit G